MAVIPLAAVLGATPSEWFPIPSQLCCHIRSCAFWIQLWLKDKHADVQIQACEVTCGAADLNGPLTTLHLQDSSSSFHFSCIMHVCCLMTLWVHRVIFLWEIVSKNNITTRPNITAQCIITNSELHVRHCWSSQSFPDHHILFMNMKLKQRLSILVVTSAFYLCVTLSETHLMFCHTLCIVPSVLVAHASTQTRLCHLSKSCNTSLILIVLTGERPGFSCGSIAFGCLHFSGNCFSRLGCSTASTLSESRSRAKYGALGCSVFPAGAHAANWRTSWRHRQPCAETGSNRFWEELRSCVAFFFCRSLRGRKCH